LGAALPGDIDTLDLRNLPSRVDARLTRDRLAVRNVNDVSRVDWDLLADLLVDSLAVIVAIAGAMGVAVNWSICRTMSRIMNWSRGMTMNRPRGMTMSWALSWPRSWTMIRNR